MITQNCKKKTILTTFVRIDVQFIGFLNWVKEEEIFGSTVVEWFVLQLVV